MKSKGFTLMEVLVALAIFGLVLGMGVYYFGNLNSREALEKDVAGVAALIREARMLSVASKEASQFGVHLESGKIVLFQGSSYAAGGANEKMMEFSRHVYLSDSSLNGGGSDMVFDRLSGNTSNYGSLKLSLKDNTASTTITVLPTGVIQ